MHCGVLTSKGGSLMIAKIKYIVQGSWIRLGFLGKWLCEIIETYANIDRT